MSSTLYPTHRMPARPLIGGVCAAIANASTLPAWIIRLATLLIALHAPIITLILYLALSIGLHRRRTRLTRHLRGLHDHLSGMAAPPPNPFSSLIDRLAHRFATLDQRLARLERTNRVRDADDRS
ncbi:phage shock protein C [Acidiphilium sp. MT5]